MALILMSFPYPLLIMALTISFSHFKVANLCLYFFLHMLCLLVLLLERRIPSIIGNSSPVLMLLFMTTQGFTLKALEESLSEPDELVTTGFKWDMVAMFFICVLQVTTC